MKHITLFYVPSDFNKHSNYYKKKHKRFHNLTNLYDIHFVFL